jgi:hypothetical protein
MWYLTFRDRLLDTIQVLKYRCEMVEDIDMTGHAVGCIELSDVIMYFFLFSLCCTDCNRHAILASYSTDFTFSFLAKRVGN